MQNNDLNELLKKYSEGKCTEEERNILEQLYDNAYDPGAEKSINKDRSAKLFAKITEQLSQTKNRRETNTRYRWMAAAGLLIFIGIGLGLFYRNRGINVQQKYHEKNDLQPGSDKALLTLSNGKKIILDNAIKGTIAKQGTVSIIKLKDGRVKYEPSSGNLSVGLNTITTPVGGKYRVDLPDGTGVWLNAQSSIQFPSVFIGTVREVTLTGEAYFEVAKNKHMPFKINVGNNKVEVLGTHFNIMAYNNEGVMKTTLIEGSVKIASPTSSRILKPLQQATINEKNDLSITDVDVEPVIAWKNGLFWFEDADIQTIMRQLSRWYNFNVKYEGHVIRKFSGTIPRNISASKVFNVLEQTGGVHFHIEGNIITVSP